MSNVFQAGVDVVYETVGGEMFDTCVKRYVTSDKNNNLPGLFVISWKSSFFSLQLLSLFQPYQQLH